MQAVWQRGQAWRLFRNAVRWRACAAAAAGQGLCSLHQPSRSADVPLLPLLVLGQIYTSRHCLVIAWTSVVDYDGEQ